MKFSEKTVHQALALAVLAGLTGGLAVADTIYVNDNWGAAPTKSDATFPYEDKAETRFYLNVQNGKFYTSNFEEVNPDGTINTGVFGPAEDGLANGIDYVLTGAEEKQYFDNSSVTYQALAGGTPITGYDDPTTDAVESLNLTYGTDAFGTVREAFEYIAATAGTFDNLTIVVDSGIYFETLWIPRNNIATGTNAYYGNNNSEFNGKFQVGLTIKGPRNNRPVFTRGSFLQDETTQGMTFDGLSFQGIPGVNGTGAHPEGTYAATTGVTRQDIIEVNNPGGSGATGANAVGTVLADQQPGFREDLTIQFCTLDGLGIRVPFDDRSPVDAAIPAYTTPPAFNNIADAGGGRGGIELRGEYGTITFSDNILRGTRSFATFDSEEANGNNTTWTNYIFDRNTVEDVWGSAAIRGQDPRQGVRATVGLYASLQDNTFRDLCVGAIQSYVPDASVTTPVQLAGYRAFDAGQGDTFADVDFIYDQRTQAGGFIKIFNIVDADLMNNSFINAAPTRDWFTKAVKVPPGHPDFLPMGAGMLIRDVADDPITTTSNYRIQGNLFEKVQQGVAVDQPGTLPYVPGGIMSGNTFIGCLSGFFVWDAVFYPFSMTITNNIFSSPSLDPTGIGVTPGTNYQAETIGGIVIASGAGVDDPGTVVDFSGNFFQDTDGSSNPNGEAGINNNSGGAPSNGVQVTDSNYTGDESGEFEENFPTLDTDADGINDVVEDTNGNGIVDGGETDPNNPDSDNDGLSDGLEARIGTDPLDINSPGGSDSDNDTLPDAVELVNGTNPNSPDTDGDGIRDDYEYLVGTNGNNANSVPSFGDANEDGTTDNVDAVRIIEAFLNINVLNITNKDRVDMNRDGVIDNVDAIILFNKVVGNISYIPFP